MKFVAQILCAALFSLIFVVAVFAFIAGIFLVADWITGQQFSPRGAGWGIMLIASGIAGWKVGYQIPNNLDLIAEIGRWATESKIGRGIIVISSLWLMTWSVYCYYNVRSSDYYCYENCGWGEQEWVFYVAGLFGVPIGALVAYLVFRWVKAGK